MNTVNSPAWIQALDRLKEGNSRFQAGLRSADAMNGHLKLKDLAANGQTPFATVLCCSDSRVPAELLFDAGFGELFVVRVAGNVVQPSQIASVEFAAKVLGSTLCVVMGHSKCGAVQAALDAEQGNAPRLGRNIETLIGLIRPAVRDVLDQNKNSDGLLDRCVDQNVRTTSRELMATSMLLRSMEAENQFRVVEAVLDISTGKVNFRAAPNEKTTSAMDKLAF